IVWVNAPAGAGKTTLVSTYVESRGLKELWYQVDRGDADMATFFYYFGQAVKHTTRTRKKMPSLTPEYQLGVPEFTRNYFREVFQRVPAPMLLVLDNFQNAGAEADLNKMLPSAFDAIPKGISIIIVSRTEPPAPFSRLQANQQLLQINWEDLQFTVEEELSITQQRYPQCNISKQQLKKLDEHIRGWVTGLILLLEQGVELDDIDLDTEDLSQERLFDYFATEIFYKLDTETRQFLMKTTMLPKMTAQMCKQLTGNHTAGKILSELTRKQYFTVRHGLLKSSYEYHPLFQGFLHHQAQENFDELEYKQIQSQAGSLLAEAGDIDHAANLLIKGENWPALNELILKHAKQQIENGRNRQIVCWIEAIPADAADQHPWLFYWLGMAQLQYENNLAREAFEKSWLKFKDARNVKGLYLSWCGIADSYTFSHSSFVNADRWIKELDWLQQNYSKPLNLEVRAHLAFSATGLILWAQPAHPDLSTWMGKIETTYRFIPNKILKALCAMQLSTYYVHMGEMIKLRHLCNKIKKQGLLKEQGPIFMILTIIAVYANDWITAEFKVTHELIDRHQQKVRDEGIKIFSGLMLAQAIYHATCRRDIPRVEKLLDMYGDDITETNTLDQGHYQLLTSYFEIVRGDFDRAIEHGKLAVELIDQTAAPFPTWVSHAGLAYLYAEKGQFNLVLKHVDAVDRIVEPMKSSAGIFIADMIRCYLAFHQNDLIETKKSLARCFRLGREKDIRGSGVWPPRMVSTLCGLALEHDIEPDYARTIVRSYHYTPRESLYVGEHWPWLIKIYSLGRFSLLLNDQPLDTETRPIALLKVLLAYGGRNVHSEKIMDALWPEAEGDQAQINFKTTLHRLRKVFGDYDVLILKNYQLSLNEQLVWVDVWVMGRLFASAEKHAESKDAPSAELLSRLTQYYRGHFLASESANWVILQRETLRARFIRHTIVLGGIIEAKDSQAAVQCYLHLLEIDPLIEEAWQGLIRCYQAQGRHAEAQVSYAKCINVLSTLGVSPSVATTALIES
ncbi:MAG TPA: hypothetical protein ENK04_15230, partial [Gammaproteobacteria bacterium]|nr:hypothetical protein [Gammaproteobacteria bacterium]